MRVAWSTARTYAPDELAKTHCSEEAGGPRFPCGIYHQERALQEFSDSVGLLTIKFMTPIVVDPG